MSKQKAMRNTGKRKYEMGSALNSMKTENITDTPIYLALNMSKVVNNEESFNRAAMGKSLFHFRGLGQTRSKTTEVSDTPYLNSEIRSVAI